MKQFPFYFLCLFLFSLQAQNPKLSKKQVFGKEMVVLPEKIKQDMRLSNDKPYLIEGLVVVEAGKTLTIEKGTTIYAKTDLKNEFGEKTASVLVVQAGAKIIAEGTKDAPIVFTSDKALNKTAQPADWIGVQIFGQGGNSNSGILKYVRIEYAGEELVDAGDAALSLVNLGKGTSIDYVQSYRSGSEGIRVRSGEAILKHLVVTEAQKHSVKFSHLDIVSFDDSFRGGVQFLITYHEKPSTEDDILLRSGSQAVMANVTMTGAGRNQDQKADGIRLKGEKTGLKLVNSIICNYSGKGFELNENNIAETELNEVYVFKNKQNFSVKDSQKDITKIKKVSEKIIEGKITATGFVPISEIKSSFNPQTLSPNFEKVMYVGAFKDNSPENNWTRGWCLGLNGEIVQ
jgi:hypothetical protein